MRSIRTKITLLNVIGIVVSIAAATLVGTISIARFGHESAEKELALLCETGKSNINYYLKSVEQSVNTVSRLIDDNLDEFPDADFNTAFSQHIEESRVSFSEAARNTNGVLTYYYRIDPSISDVTGEKGFWYVDQDGNGFQEHEVTDLSDDQFECIWFYTPKETGKPIWLSPYVTDNLNEYVISYNVPVYKGEQKDFIGVVGIEISYATLGEQIDSISVSGSGYAFIIENQNGTIIYHPTIDILAIPEKDRPSVPTKFLESFKKGEHHCEYVFQGVEKHSYWMDLSNDMVIVVAVPFSDINKTWLSMITIMIIVAVAVIGVFVSITIVTARHITKPLQELTRAAKEINNGNYDVRLDYKGKDEIGVLTRTFNKLIENLGEYISDLNSLAYADALTSANNKSAFDLKMEEMEIRVEDESNLEFAIALFDCDNLKDINDAYGHDKGDVYLRGSSNLISRIFVNSTVYRIGGDEFAIILEGEDYANREKLKNLFFRRSKEICSFAKNPWEKIKVSVGIAVYDSSIDKSAKDVLIHADHLMYSNKRSRKKKN